MSGSVFVTEADRDEILEELVELLNVARSVAFEVVCTRQLTGRQD